jgi:hypothetical protein
VTGLVESLATTVEFAIGYFLREEGKAVCPIKDNLKGVQNETVIFSGDAREICVEAKFHYPSQPLEKVRRGKAADQKK